MRLRLIILSTVSAAAIVAPPAAAQTLPATPPTAGQGTTAPPAAPPEAQDNQNSPAGGTPAAAQDAAGADATASSDADALGATGNDIVVTGLRRSLESAQNIKRNSDQQVDSIVASDIGKLPDVAISDTAARIPGIQVERAGGEASRVLLRGLDNNYYTTTYNGREIFTAEARSVALQDFPAGAISALEVFKTTTADLVEGGVAGEVNVRSRKPFDFDGLEIAGSAWGQYTTRSKSWTPNGNLLVSDRWDTGFGEIGALINFSYTSLDYLDSTRSNTDFIASPTVAPANTSLRFPDIQRVDYGEGKRTRPSLNGALQWRPAPGLEFYGEALWQGFRNQVSDRETEVPLYGGSAYNNVLTQSGSNLANSFTVVNPNRPDGFQGATYGKTDTFQYAIGGKWDSGPAHLSFDAARTATKYLDSVYSLDMAYAAPTTVTVDTGLGGNNGPSFSLANVDPTNPSTYIARGFFDRQLIAKGEDWQARVDGSYDTGIDVLPKIEAGFRYVDRDAHFQDGSRYANIEANRTPYSSLPIGFEQSTSGFPSDDPETIRGYYTGSYDGIRDNVDALRTFVGFPTGAPPADPTLTYDSNEKSYAAYGQVKYAIGSPDGIRVDGTIGLRVVRTDFALQGTSTAVNAAGTTVLTPVNSDRSYTDWLPNVNARVRFTDKLQLRLSITKTRSRPGFASFNPAVNAGPVPGCEFVNGVLTPPAQNPAAASCIRNTSGGNAALEPYTSKNYDASLEYYFSRTGQVAAAVFRRDLNGFILNSTSDSLDENGYTLRTSAPYNSAAGRIQGAEGLFTTFLDFPGLPTWLRSFGIDSNITYIDAKTGQYSDALNTVQQRQIQGVSKWTYNVGGIYEHGGLSARLSWNYRSDYLGTFQVRDAVAATNQYNIYSETVRGVGRLDFSGSYDVNKHLTLTADWTNMLATPQRVDMAYDYHTGPYAGTGAGFPRSVQYQESVVSGGIRFRF